MSKKITLSVIIPAYNAGEWLPKSVPRIAEAITRADVASAEIIIVDDGSTDNTKGVAKSLELDYPVKVISQSNSGRFIARQNGVKAARHEYILLIDTRIYIGKDSLKYIVDRLTSEKDNLIWTSHVIIDKDSNPYARFWEAITFVAWRKYFSNPRYISYGIKDFDHYPKGTTCFFVPKSILKEANGWFVAQTKNAKASNDDTLLIRRMAESNNINISPHFNCTYHARTNLKQFCKHAYHRGKVFVDGFLRRDGNRFFWPLLTFLLLSIIVPMLLIIFPSYIFIFGVTLFVLWICELLVSLLLNVPVKDAFSLFLLTPIFSLVYGAGIWKAVFDIYVRRK